MACSSQDLQVELSATIKEEEKPKVLSRYGPFNLEKIDQLPEEYKGVKDREGILTTWNSNTYIKVLDDEGHFEVTDHYGEPLTEGREYILMA